MENLKHTVCDLFIDRVEKSPENNALGIIKKEKIQFLTFSSYKNYVEAYSLGLMSLGLKKQNKVCLLSLTRMEWNLLDLATLCAGAVTVPIYPSYTGDEINFILNHSEANFLILEDNEQFEKILKIQKKLPTSLEKIISIHPIKIELSGKLEGIEVLSLDDLHRLGSVEIQKSPDQFETNIKNITAESLATIVYTSGTTGEPKGAMINHEAIFQVLKNVKKYTHNSIYNEDRFLTYLPLSHVLGRLESFFPILFNCEGVYAQNMKTLVSDIELARPTFLVAVPRVLEKIYERAMAKIEENELKKLLFSYAENIANDYFETIEQDKTPDSKLIIEYQLAKKFVFNKIYNMFGGKIRYIISGGAPLSPKISQFLRNANLTVLEGYGLTETIAPCCINPMNKQVLGTVGKPMGDVEIKFAKDNEILIRSKALFSGYYKNQKETDKALDEDGWFASGDIGFFDNQGFLNISDRKKDIIITSGGKNIAPQKLENMLKLRPYISQAVVVGNKRKYLTALIGVEFENFLEKLEQLQISPTIPLKDLVNLPEISSIIEEQVEIVNEQLASYEKIKKFRIIPTEITTDNYLTPSLKTKKKLILRDFMNLIEGMYKES